MTQTQAAISKRSQTDKILDFLLAGHHITALDALELFGCFRLAARIAEIRERGYEVYTRYETGDNGKRYAVYSLPDAETEASA